MDKLFAAVDFRTQQIGELEHDNALLRERLQDAEELAVAQQHQTGEEAWKSQQSVATPPRHARGSSITSSEASVTATTSASALASPLSQESGKIDDVQDQALPRHRDEVQPEVQHKQQSQQEELTIARQNKGQHFNVEMVTAFFKVDTHEVLQAATKGMVSPFLIHCSRRGYFSSPASFPCFLYFRFSC